jgi:hypothetical protein
MVTIRLHVDRADEESGCLRVIPGALACAVEAGDAVAIVKRCDGLK